MKGDLLYFSLGRSKVLGAQRGLFVRLPWRLSVSEEFRDVGSLPKGVFFNGGYRGSHNQLTFQLFNHNFVPVQLGRKQYVYGVLIPGRV